jgi:gamma-glutamylcyclotransferase (GGCT)/AIG2-like uncharacterized protein YtfP
MPEMKYTVFVYGTLRDKSVRKTVLGSNPFSKTASLKGFTMSSIELDGNEYPIIAEDPMSNEIIEGEYFEVDQAGIDNLDWYESTAYHRKEVELEDGIRAWVYYRAKK